ncbi:MAG: hypothetical protein WCA26_05105, partial [Xanthobacteraceae bacterium]
QDARSKFNIIAERERNATIVENAAPTRKLTGHSILSFDPRGSRPFADSDRCSPDVFFLRISINNRKVTVF